MKNKTKIQTVGMALLMSIMLTGCSTGNSDSQSSGDNSESLSESTESAPESTESEPEDTESEPEHKLSDGEMKLVSELKLKSFVGPDGETVYAEDADYVFDTLTEHTEAGSQGYKSGSECYSDDFEVDENGELTDPEIITTVLRYDFAYIRYCRPLFYMGERLDDDVEQKMIDGLPEDKWFKVKAGDKIDCGLTVKEAVYERFTVESHWPTRDNYIEFDGDITLEGLLFTAKDDGNYLTKMGDLVFMPDATKTNGIPDSTDQFEPDNVITRTMYNGSYVLYDGGAAGWVVGTVDDIDKNYIFRDDEIVRVKLTLTNIRYGGISTGIIPAFYAEIIDIERAD